MQKPSVAISSHTGHGHRKQKDNKKFFFSTFFLTVNTVPESVDHFYSCEQTLKFLLKQCLYTQEGIMSCYIWPVLYTGNRKMIKSVIIHNSEHSTWFTQCGLFLQLHATKIANLLLKSHLFFVFFSVFHGILWHNSSGKDINFNAYQFKTDFNFHASW